MFSKKDKIITELRQRISELELSKKQLNEAKNILRINEEKNRALVENSPDYIMNLDRDGLILYINKPLLNLSVKEIIGMKIRSFADQEYHDILKKKLVQVYEEGKSEGIEIKKTLDNGQTIWFEIRFASINIEDSVFVAMLIVTDITNRKTAEEELRIKESAISSAITGIVIADLDGKLNYINESLVNMWGYSHEELTGKNLNILFSKPKIMDEVIKSINEKSRFIGELLAKKKDRTLFTIILTANMIKDEEGKPNYIMGSMLDITERKNMEKKLSEYREHLEELVESRTLELTYAKEIAEKANKAKSKFLASMSHELRTPLNSIIGFAKLMRMGYVMNEYESNLANIVSSGEHLLNLINDILDLSKIESGKMKFDMKPIEMHKIINESIQIIKPMTEKKQITLVYNTECKDAQIFGDRRWIQQIFINLLNNAVKFTPEGGNVDIITKEIKGTYYADVIDTGIGINPDDIKVIFEEFSQVYRKGLDDIIEGTGLGLPITKKLVDAHSGEIMVKSTVGKGSTFSVLLPCVRHSFNEIPDNLERKINLARAFDDYILIVDDKKQNRELLCSYFDKCGQKYITAESGEKSIEIMNEYNNIRLILMDVKLNGMSGVEAMKIIKAKFQVPVIAVTAFAMEGDHEKFINDGFDDYLSKPIDIDTLGDKIMTWTR